MAPPDEAFEDALLVRLAQPNEAELVWKLMRAGFEEYRAYALPSSALSESLAEVRRELAKGGAVLAFVGERPVACARFKMENRTLSFSRMAVLPEVRRAGIGKTLVNYLEAHARRRGLDEVTLTARSEQPDNRPYYEKLGYKVVGYSERYGLAKLVTHMRKSLT
jgi:ribosomal protein S18 acetylase RimI-like enzyme